MNRNEAKILEEAFQWLREAKLFINQNKKSSLDLLLLDAIENFTAREDKNYRASCPYCGQANMNCDFSYPHPK